MFLTLKSSTTSKRIQVFVADSTLTTGAGKTGLTNASFTAYYWLDGATTATSITLAAGTLGTWSSGGIKEMDATNMPGWYEFGIPNAALVGSSTVQQSNIMIKGTGVVPVNIVIQLSGVDMSDAVRMGLTSLPNVAQGSAGALPTADSSGRVTVITNSDKTGYGLAATDSYINNSGTAQAGAGSTITLAAGASATNSIYVGQLVKITSGTGAGQSRLITAYVGATKVATVGVAWQTNPDSTSVYQVMFEDGNTFQGQLSFASGRVLSQVGGYQSGQDPAALVLDTADTVDNPANCSTPRHWLRVLISIAAGQASGLAGTTAVFKNINGATKTRVSATVDANGNRTAIGTLDGT
jgi:hypothetical protein